MELKSIIRSNPGILLSDKKIRALLSDVFLNDQLSINVMMNAYNIGIISDMREKYPAEHFTETRWIKKLVSDYGISEKKAAWAINNWKAAVDQQIIMALDESEKQVAHVREEEERAFLEQASFRIEAEKAAREEKKQKTHDNRLNTAEDNGDYYINPTLPEKENCIYIPCGFGKGDNGFFVHGISGNSLCEHPDANVYALIYNYLIRSSTITKGDIPKCLRNIESVYELDYQAIYRIAISLLQMIHHNLITSNTVTLNYSEDLESLNYAVLLINCYAELFCRLIHIRKINLLVKTGKNGIPFSIRKKIKGIYVEDNKKTISNARELWYGRKIKYHLTKKDLPDMEYILQEISDFDGFKEGQFSALCDMLACNGHAVCIMPTGSGKSLIFYLTSLLQPLPMFIVSPTDILIQDQIRNLKKFHHMDNVAHLQLTGENSFADWEIRNSLNYITPMTFQNRNLLVKSKYLNNGTEILDLKESRIAPGPSISYIVLDEIHCLSNWGHDFRPEYLMLSRYLNKYLDNVSFWGFTATANYTVVEDVQKQLNIPQTNFFSPISFEKFNVSYDYRIFHTEDEMLHAVSNIAAELVSKDERTIVFTKSDAVSERVADAIGWEADIFMRDNPVAYYHFAAGESKILVASGEIGVGINLPDIRNVIHFGLPLSKNEYVQEIGRAGRANEKVKSYILYLDTSEDNVPAELLKRSTPIRNLPTLIEGYKNDYVDVYQKLSNEAVSDNELYNQLIWVYQKFVKQESRICRMVYPNDTIEKSKQLLYMLYLTGYINDWYSYSQTRDGKGVVILVDIAGEQKEYKADQLKMLNHMKESMHDYFVYMGNSRESIAKVSRAKTPEEVIRIYVNWYYEKYLYHHNEQFLDLFEFIQSNAECDDDKITEEIKDYFVLPFAKLKSDEVLFNELSLKEIISKTLTGVSKNTLVNLERINSNRYSYKLDLALFCGNLRMNGMFDAGRLDRILSGLPGNDILQLANALTSFYPSCSSEVKIRMLNYVEQNAMSLKITYMDFVKRAYKNSKKDDVYYGIMASVLNKCFNRMRRTGNV